ncbi:hypothetical protein GF352_01630 [archaeon]|nr:hypothetical protein [archaeon]
MKMSFKERVSELYFDEQLSRLYELLPFLKPRIDYGYEVINKNLYEDCLAHRDSYKRVLRDEVLLMVHHEFALFSPHKERYEDLISNYQQGLDELISIARRGDWSIALFTFPELYVHHKGLIERGSYDTAFFTQFCKGVPYNDDLSELKPKSLFISGCYGEFCIKELIHNLKLIGCEDMTLVPEAVLLPPKDEFISFSGLDELKIY